MRYLQYTVDALTTQVSAVGGKSAYNCNWTPQFQHTLFKGHLYFQSVLGKLPMWKAYCGYADFQLEDQKGLVHLTPVFFKGQLFTIMHDHEGIHTTVYYCTHTSNWRGFSYSNTFNYTFFDTTVLHTL